MRMISSDAPIISGSKYQFDERLPLLIRNGKHLSPGSHAQYYLQLSKTWDSGNKRIRERILNEFIRGNWNKTGPQLEKELGNGASLFLARISAWLRLTYLFNANIALQLQAVRIFISAANGHRYLAEFLETGGVLTVLEITSLSRATEDDKSEALKLLLNVAGAGRKYKEFICESYGVRAVAECMSISKSEVSQDHAKNLLVQLGTGNPKYLIQVYKALVAILASSQTTPSAQQMACQALRTILPGIPTVHATVADVSMTLLKSIHIQLQYEAYELLRELCKRPELSDTVTHQLIAILKASRLEHEDADDDDLEPFKKSNIGAPGQLKKSAEETHKRNLKLLSQHIQQAYASRLVGYMIVVSRDLAEKLIAFQVVSGLLNVVANVEHNDSQRYASNALQYLLDHFPLVARCLSTQMGNTFVELIKTKPDTYYKELNKTQVYYLRKNTVRVYVDEQLSEGNENLEPNLDDLREDVPRSSPFATVSFPDARADTDNDKHNLPSDLFSSTGLKSVSPLTQSQSSKEASKRYGQDSPPNGSGNYSDGQDTGRNGGTYEIHTPYAQITQSGTYPGSKFTATTKQDAKEIFELELTRFKKGEKTKDIIANVKAGFSLKLDAADIPRLTDLQSIDLFRREAKLPELVMMDDSGLDDSSLKRRQGVEIDVGAAGMERLREEEDGDGAGREKKEGSGSERGGEENEVQSGIESDVASIEFPSSILGDKNSL